MATGEHDIGDKRASAWLPFAVLLASTVAVIVLAAPPHRTDRMAAVFPPWWSRQAVAAAAIRAGQIDAAGGWSNVLIIRSSRPGLAHRLNAAGAWLLVDADLARACTAKFLDGAPS